MVDERRAPSPLSAANAMLSGPAWSAIAVLAATTVVATVDPHEPGHYPTCPFLALTGRPCPLCGGLRAVNSLTSGRFADAAGSNVLVVVGIVVAVTLWVRWTALRLKGKAVPYFDVDPRLAATGVAVFVVFGIVRNLPFGAALAP